MLIGSSLKKGSCEIETKNLDGETNTKEKFPNKKVYPLVSTEKDAVRNLNGSLIECEAPNEFLYTFNGNFTVPSLNGGKPMPIDAESILLRGSSLTEADFIYGVAVYTGHETKIMKNSTGARAKKSDVERKTDKYIILLVLI